MQKTGICTHIPQDLCVLAIELHVQFYSIDQDVKGVLHDESRFPKPDFRCYRRS